MDTSETDIHTYTGASLILLEALVKEEVSLLEAAQHVEGLEGVVEERRDRIERLKAALKALGVEPYGEGE